MSQLKKIAVVIPYFGRWPDWINYFLHSCTANSSIDWIILTDCSLPRVNADNLQFVPFTLNDFNDIVSEKLGLELDIEHPYKICDLKPAYGELFADLLKGYDFWGYGDLDLVYGDIRKFFPYQILDEYDILSNHEDFVPGHFCLLKNSPKINALYKAGNHYRNAFSDKLYTGFDERLKKKKINPDPEFLINDQYLDRQVHIYRSRLIKKINRLSPFRAGLRSNLKNRTRNSSLSWDINSVSDTNSSANSNSIKDSGPTMDSISSMDFGSIRDFILTKDFSSIVQKAMEMGFIKVSYSKRFESDLMLTKLGNKNWEAKWTEGSLRSKNGKELLYFHFILSKRLESFNIMKDIKGLKEFRITPEGINY